VRRLEDMSAAELEARFPARRPPPASVPHGTDPKREAVPRLKPASKPVARKRRGPRPAPDPEPVLLTADCGACGRGWAETSRSTACPFCGAER
jgi:hypothetical protein